MEVEDLATDLSNIFWKLWCPWHVTLVKVLIA